jgi:hypothetical protein
MTGGFTAALLAFLLERDISGYRPDRPPATELKAQIQEAELPSVATFVREFEWTEAQVAKGIPATDFWEACKRWFEETGADNRYLPRNVSSFGLKIKALVDSFHTKTGNRYRPKGGVAYHQAEEPNF